MKQVAASARLVIILGAISAFAPLSIDMYLPGFAAIRHEFGASAESVQWTLSAFFIGLAAGQFFYGPLADHFGRKPPLAVGLVLYTLASIGCGLAPNVETLIAMRTLQALGGCAGVVIAQAMVRDLFEPQVGARVLSRLVLVFGVAPIIAPSIGAWIVRVSDWRAIFWILTAIGAACLVSAMLLLPETRPRRSDRPPLALMPVLRDYWSLLSERRFLGFASAVSLTHASVMAYVTAGAFVFIQLYGLSPTQFALLFALNACALVIGAQWNAHLLKSHGAATLLTRTTFIPPILCAVLIVLTVHQTGGIAALIAVMWPYLFTMSIVRPDATACALADHAERAGTASSLIGVLQFLLATLAGVFMGLIHDGTAKPMAITMTLLTAAGFVLHRWLTRNPAPQ
ncbi:MAG TPA: Bcr/CflA family multidrug efflux MFS transporter [Steroidobacteraceae bacterium]|nr:Bcr/CflA family multidrug efflux MFS transporter [Steroidobacteraceae bacterium]